MAPTGNEQRLSRVLILGGTKEAATIAERLASRADIAVTTSLAGRTRHPLPVAGSVRRGGFGGVQGLASYIDETGTALVIDATHPFATRISAHAAQATSLSGTTLLHYQRPPWQAVAGDRWIDAKTIEEAVHLIPARACVLLALGRQHIVPFARRSDCRFILRMVDRPEDPLPVPSAHVITGRPSDDPDDEIALFRAHGIDVLVCRNSGGQAAAAKLTAARLLQRPVIMIARPDPGAPTGRTFKDIDALLCATDQALAFLPRLRNR